MLTIYILLLFTLRAKIAGAKSKCIALGSTHTRPGRDPHWLTSKCLPGAGGMRMMEKWSFGSSPGRLARGPKNQVTKKNIPSG